MGLTHNSFSISADKSKLDIDLIHEFLTNSYWAAGRSRELVEKTIKHSLCFGVYNNAKQVGFARVITDYVVLAYVADVFILEPYRGIGLGKKLVGAILSHPELQGIKKWMLATSDAHGLYSQFGFRTISNPEKFMEMFNPAPAK
ncbi:MAG: GNAT family N-acetyltransferase [Ignavibacteriaceae bacterium]|nr:GNAT family N-acetyltransferase [Ignavibacteriaceae bacterium]